MASECRHDGDTDTLQRPARHFRIRVRHCEVCVSGLARFAVHSERQAAVRGCYDAGLLERRGRREHQCDRIIEIDRHGSMDRAFVTVVPRM